MIANQPGGAFCPQSVWPRSRVKEKLMSDLPTELKYASSHEWARLDSDGTVVVGITDHAQEALGDIVYIELPEAGASVDAGAEVAVVESVPILL